MNSAADDLAENTKESEDIIELVSILDSTDFFNENESNAPELQRSSNSERESISTEKSQDEELMDTSGHTIVESEGNNSEKSMIANEIAEKTEDDGKIENSEEIHSEDEDMSEKVGEIDGKIAENEEIESSDEDTGPKGQADHENDENRVDEDTLAGAPCNRGKVIINYVLPAFLECFKNVKT